MNNYTNSTLDLLLKVSNAKFRENSISKDRWYVERNRKREEAEKPIVPEQSIDDFRKMWQELHEEALLNPYVPEGCEPEAEKEATLFDMLA